MNQLSIVLLSVGLTLACNSNPGTAQAQTPSYQSYGTKITADGAMNTADFHKAMQGKDSLNAKLQVEIITTCQKKGCWMDVRMPDGSPMKVRFTDYAFFVPTAGQEGKTCIIQGKASREVITEAMRRHYAHDAGKSKEECEKITGDAVNLTFLADGVLIKQ